MAGIDEVVSGIGGYRISRVHETYNVLEVPRVGSGLLRAIVLKGLNTCDAVDAVGVNVVLKEHTIPFRV